MSYIPTIWKNGESPNINGTNLNKIEKRLQDVRMDAQDGLVIECRTNDPVAPVVGQIWLRTDLLAP
jgi:hypothetical protein